MIHPLHSVWSYILEAPSIGFLTSWKAQNQFDSTTQKHLVIKQQDHSPPPPLPSPTLPVYPRTKVPSTVLQNPNQELVLKKPLNCVVSPTDYLRLAPSRVQAFICSTHLTFPGNRNHRLFPWIKNELLHYRVRYLPSGHQHACLATQLSLQFMQKRQTGLGL